jgi:hypothetical protein
MQCLTYHCKACEFIFKDPDAIVSLEKELKVYEQHNNSEENLGYVGMFQDFMDKTFLPYKNHIRTILDFGSGPTPVLAKLMQKDGFDVEHYDKFFSPQKVYEGKTYDLITSTEVIEHIADIQAVLELFSEHLNSDGYLAVMTQFHTDVPQEYLKWWYRRDPTHISFFRPKTFEVLARKYGLTVLFHDSKKLILMQKSTTL